MKCIGESEWLLQERFSEHKSYAMNLKVNKATGEHFSQIGHKVSDMKNEKIPASQPQGPSLTNCPLLGFWALSSTFAK